MSGSSINSCFTGSIAHTDDPGWTEFGVPLTRKAPGLGIFPFDTHGNKHRSNTASEPFSSKKTIPGKTGIKFSNTYCNHKCGPLVVIDKRGRLRTILTVLFKVSDDASASIVYRYLPPSG